MLLRDRLEIYLVHLEVFTKGLYDFAKFIIEKNEGRKETALSQTLL